LVNDLTVGELGLWVFRVVSAQKDAHDIATISLYYAFSHYLTRDLANTAKVVSKATILASRKVDKEIEHRFGEVSPERFEQRIERIMVQRVDAMGRCVYAVYA
jgi:hypothetical protein